jgi:hypothetical protein
MKSKKAKKGMTVWLIKEKEVKVMIAGETKKNFQTIIINKIKREKAKDLDPDLNHLIIRLTMIL